MEKGEGQQIIHFISKPTINQSSGIHNSVCNITADCENTYLGFKIIIIISV